VRSEDDGLSFWEGVEHFYTGNGEDVRVKFSSVDPGWKYDDIIGVPLCKNLSALKNHPEFESPYPSHFDVFQTLYQTKILHLFSGLDIVHDEPGNSGPGQIEIVWEGSFNAIKTNRSETVERYDVTVVGTIYAKANLFDFDPGWKKGRSWLGENITINARNLQDRFGAGTDFWVCFDGSREEFKSTSCCCEKTRNHWECK
jgi:hypothetical protein